MEEGFPFDDAHLEARRDQLKIKEPKDLFCQSKNKVAQMCFKSSCSKLSLLCGQKECPSCREEHNKCPIVSLQGVTKSINKHYPTKKYIVEQVETIQNKFFKVLKDTSSRLGEEIRFAGLGDKERRVAEEIYDKSNAQWLKGKETAQFYSKLDQYERNKPSMESIRNILSQYEQTLQKVLKTAADIKQLLCRQLSPKAVSNKIGQNVVKPETNPMFFIHSNSNAFESSILNLSKVHAETLSSILGEEGRVQRVERLFRASEYSFSAKAFHEKCDNQEDTLVLVRTEFGKTIGGYTHYPWTSAGSWESVNDSGRRAFLFSLDMREKFVPQGNGELVYRNSCYGPIFGGGHDIVISDCCNNSSSYADFPNTYNRAGGNKLANNEDTWRMFSGGDTKYFRVQQYEVFRVWYS